MVHAAADRFSASVMRYFSGVRSDHQLGIGALYGLLWGDIDAGSQEVP
jgi:hypothetical protein